jgi:pimeloyl-ACP methyl ester carboxylesterase
MAQETFDPISGSNRKELVMTEARTSGPRSAEPGAATQDATIRPFRVSVADEDLVELRRRIEATRWPERETVDDDSQGVPLATMQELARSSLHGSFQLYRAFPTTTAQNEQRKTRRLTLPVLAIGGAESSGAMVADTMQLVADDVQTLVIPGCGHWVAEQAPEELLAALTAFLAPYRNGVPA